MTQPTPKTLIQRAWKAGRVVPAFNIAYLPMMNPLVRALQDCRAFGLMQVSRPDWEKFGAGSPRAVRAAYRTCKDEAFTRLHLDHVPVVDEDGQRVNYRDLIAEALDLGYESVMIDGSRLPLAENIAATREVAEQAAPYDAAVEAELGAVLGHEKGPLPPYEELFASGQGFTDVEEARRFAAESGADWLSCAIGNVHGAISGAARSQQKVAARLHIEQLDKLQDAIGLPLVLHGGSGIRAEYLQRAFRHGIAKINVGTTIRQAWEQGLEESEETAQKQVYESACTLLRGDLQAQDSVDDIRPQEA